mmetsp:Transcript_23617/g.47670  ORF Transcript_23617/g.47670 Transcript_23617/m.47670 type:complete len:296 (+) Transcript_23617:596-1483(+)
MFIDYSAEKLSIQKGVKNVLLEKNHGGPQFHLDRYASFKIFSFFSETRLNQHLRIKVKGIKFFPTLVKKKKSNNFNQFFKNFEHISSDKKIDKNFFQKSPSIKYLTKSDLIRNQIPKFSNKIERGLSSIEFEESADEIKVNLTTSLVKLCISQNFLVGRCWLTVKSSSRKNKDFWYSYLSSCYNFMTKIKTSPETKLLRKEITSQVYGSVRNSLDSQFFQIQRCLEKNVNINRRKRGFSSIINLGRLTKFGRLNSEKEKSSTHWRNRVWNKRGLFKLKKNQNFYKSHLKTFLLLG